ncbi:MAG: M42 family metallopeptidase [Christensenellales bacterium]|jgi:putative aminopeptidase FrvX
MPGRLDRSIIRALSDIYAVSGDEGRVRKQIKEFIAPYVDEMFTDYMGNLIVRKSGKKDGAKKVLLSAHMDEVGMLVRGITEDGLLAIDCRSIDPRVMISKRVVVGKEHIPGVIGAKAIHQQTREEFGQALRYNQIYVDIGATAKKDAEKYVAVGDHICFTTKFEDFGEGLMKGKALDDRIGCAVIVQLLKDDYDCDLYAAFTVQEECGLRGAHIAAHRIKPDVNLNFEGTTANDIPLSEGHQLVSRVGDGAVFTVMDRGTIVNRSMTNALIEAAKSAGAKWQLRRGNAGGTDMGAIHTAAAGCISGGISVPCRYIHAPSSVASWDDMENAYKIGRAFLSENKFDEVKKDV